MAREKIVEERTKELVEEKNVKERVERVEKQPRKKAMGKNFERWLNQRKTSRKKTSEEKLER
jgi:hypothetical protein